MTTESVVVPEICASLSAFAGTTEEFAGSEGTYPLLVVGADAARDATPLVGTRSLSSSAHSHAPAADPQIYGGTKFKRTWCA